MKSKILFTLFFWVCCLSPAWGASWVVGEIMETKGSVEVSHERFGKRKGEVGLAIYRQDRITTHKKSAVKIRFLDDVYLKLGAHGKIAITEYLYAAKNVPTNQQLEVLLGQIRLGLLRAVPSGSGVFSANGGPQRLPDGPRQYPAGASRDTAGY